MSVGMLTHNGLQPTKLGSLTMMHVTLTHPCNREIVQHYFEKSSIGPKTEEDLPKAGMGGTNFEHGRISHFPQVLTLPIS
jgi:hypothetical protein